MKIYQSSIGENIELTIERKKHILERHPETENHFNKIASTLIRPDEIRIDSRDSKVLLFYKYFSKIEKYIVVVIKTNKRNFLLTFYSTYRIKTGKKYEE